MADLSVTVNGLSLPNPFVIGSGPPGTNANVIGKAFDEGWGAVIAKTISLDASKVVNVAPRYARLRAAETREVYPGKIPVVPAGGQALVFGRLIGTGRPVAVLEARTGLLPVKVETPVAKMSTTAEETRHIPGFWALEKVNRMIERGSLNAEDKARLIDLAVRHGILTRHTAFLAK